jgi:CheY-like chemotaxis protein
MRLEFEPNASALPFVEKDAVNQPAVSETDKFLREGVKAAQEGNRAEARNLLLRVTEVDSDNENAWLWLASISEYPEELLVFLNNVLRVNPHNERALEWHKATNSLLAKTLVQRGVDALGDNRRDFARQCFEQAIGHEAENEMAWLWMASVADSEDEKVACFEKVLSANPSNETAQNSLQSIQSQKTQKLFGAALAAAFDGRHADAQELLETVLTRHNDLEDAWVLKSHLANSFEERAECFLKLRALNPENELAAANLSSWHTLSNKLAEFPPPPETAEKVEFAAAAEAVAVEEFAEEISKAEETAEFSNEAEPEVAPEFITEETSFKELSAEFSDYPVKEEALTELMEEAFAENDPAPAAEEFSAEAEDEFLEVGAAEEEEEEVLEVVAPQPEMFEAAAEVEPEAAELSDRDFFADDEPAAFDAPTQDLSAANFAAPSFAGFDNPEVVEDQAVAEAVAAHEDSFTAEPLAEISFEEEETAVAVEEFSAPESELSAELEAEEEKMSWAFNELQGSKEVEDYFRSFDETDDIHRTQSANIHETQFAADEAENYSPSPASEEAEVESVEEFVETSAEAVSEVETPDWRNTSPEVFVNYLPESPENSFEAPAAEFAFEEPAVTEEFPSEAVAAAVAEQPVAEQPVAEPDALPEVFAADYDDAQPFAEEPVKEYFSEEPVEEYFSAEEILEAEEIVEVSAAEVVSTEAVEPQPREEYAHPKSELVLCPFCNTENEKQAFSCVSCHTILTLSDLEMLLNQQSANHEKLERAVGSLERENESYGLSAEQLTSLGIGHINLKNYRQGFFYLQEAVRMNPSNVLLDAQVNALAIRLSEIEEQQTAHDSMPKNRKILVVDDSPTVRKLISGKLEKCGHEVICAVDGVDALEKINELTPDLVLLDITMPRMDGYQVCKLIRNNDATKDVPVVMISGKDGFFDKVRGRMAGTTGYITKPFGPETLMKTVESYLN